MKAAVVVPWVLGALAFSVPFANASADAARGVAGGTLLPTGVAITPTAARGSALYRLTTAVRADGNADAADATATALSPDGTTLLILTSGYNTNFSTESGAPILYDVPNPLTGSAGATKTKNAEWAFVYDVRSTVPIALAKFAIPNTFDGLLWAPDGQSFYVSGGIDDRILRFTRRPGAAGRAGFAPAYPSIVLGHNDADDQPRPVYRGGLLKGTLAASASKGALTTGAVVAGLAISRDGRTLVAANLENDSLSIVDARTGAVEHEVRFTTPGSNRATGEYPYGVAVKSAANGAAEKIYVSSIRDDQVLVVDAASGALRKTIRAGSAPNALVLSSDGSRLYVANGNSDDVSVIDTGSDVPLATIHLSAADDPYKGSSPNGLALASGGERLYVTLGGANALAVVDVREGRTLGRIPTAWYPTGVAVGRDGRLYIVNEKSVPGPNPANGFATAAGKARNTTAQNQYGWALEKASLAVVPVPSDDELPALSAIVDRNNGLANRDDTSLAYLRGRIRHVIYIVKENRTYDQVLGDLPGTDGDPQLTTFPEAVTPNHHALARTFVALDNFYDPGESSGVGWNWSTQGQTNDYVERSQAVLYGNANFAGLTYDYQGTVRNLNLALPQTGGSSPFDVRESGLADPSGASSILPGARDPAADDGDGVLDPGAVGGYLWDEALRRGLGVRHYGQFVDQTYYGNVPGNIPISRTPYASHLPQSIATKTDLLDRTDAYFRGFDQAAPDIYRIEEWSREFDAFERTRTLPELELVTINHDHFGSFGTAIEGLNTPTLQIADDDYALGEMVAKISRSADWNSTAVFVIEDDSQSGPDHVDSHRSIALLASPFARRAAVIHTRYTTDNVLKSIEQILGLHPLGEHDANAAPMADLFTREPEPARYDAIVPGVLCAPPVARDLVGDACTSPRVRKTHAVADLHDGQWWSMMTAGFDFSRADRVDPVAFDALLWFGMTGTVVPEHAVL